jgi:hypothetical protein
MEGVFMLNKVSGLARTLYIVLAIVAGFVAMGTMNIALILLVLGLIAGISLPPERLVLATVTVIALPILGAALANLPAIGAQLGAVMANLQMAMAGAVTTALLMRLYELAIAGVTGFGGSEGGTARKVAA